MGSRSTSLPTDETQRADNNRVKHVSAMRRFQQLLALAADPAFSGTVAVEISAKDGHFGRPKCTLVEYDRDNK